MVFGDGVSSHVRLGNKSNEESRFEQHDTWSQIVVQRTKGLSGKGDSVRVDIQDDIACAPTSLVGTAPSERGRSRHSTNITLDDKLPAHRSTLSSTSRRRSTTGRQIDNLGIRVVRVIAEIPDLLARQTVWGKQAGDVRIDIADSTRRRLSGKHHATGHSGDFLTTRAVMHDARRTRWALISIVPFWQK